MIRIVLITLMACALVACARPTADFGRAKPSIVHDTVLPTVGKLRALMFEEPVSFLNETDDEGEMHDRVWRYLTAPHTRDWFFDVLVEWQRTRIVPQIDTSLTYDRYYAILRLERYRSSHSRYTRVTRDIQADIGTMPGVFDVICRVEEIDRRRATAAASLPSIKASQKQDARNRRMENQAYIDWFIRSAKYRYNSYSLALESLLVETPHEDARALDDQLSRLGVWVEHAERRNFCLDASGVYGAGQSGKAIPSRMISRPFTPEPVFRK